MRRDAEAHAAEDKEKRELVDLRNQADHALHESERQLSEHKSKLSSADLKAIEDAREELKTAAKGESRDALQRALSNLQTRAQKLGEAVYGQTPNAGSPESGPASGAGPGPSGGGKDAQHDEPVDADFEVKT